MIRPSVPAQGALRVTATSPGLASDSLELEALCCLGFRVRLYVGWVHGLGF